VLAGAALWPKKVPAPAVPAVAPAKTPPL